MNKEQRDILNRAYAISCEGDKWKIGNCSVKPDYLYSLFKDGKRFPSKFIVVNSLIDIPNSIRYEQKCSYIDDVKCLEVIIKSRLKETKYINFANNYIEKRKHLIKILESSKDSLMVIDDGLDNIAMLCIFLNKTPKDMSSELGKSAWRFYCSSDIKVNNAIVDLINTNNLPSIEILRSLSLLQNIKNKSDAIKLLNVMHDFRFDLTPECIKYVLNIKNLSHLSLGEVVILYNDTKSMMINSEYNFNEGWSLKRLKEEHDALMRVQTIKKYGIKSSDIFDVSIKAKNNLKDIKAPENIEYKVLTTGLDYCEEALLMKHCIASFAKKAKNGSYVTIHISNKEYESTLGISVFEDDFNLNQIKGIFNNSDIPEDIMSFARSLIFNLNSVNKFENKYKGKVNSNKSKLKIELLNTGVFDDEFLDQWEF